jgi:prephenate dehydrogenase
MADSFARIAIAGTGLIGGSFALAARSVQPGVHIAGWDRPEVLDRALALGIIDVGHNALREAVAGADLIYIALPVRDAIESLPQIMRHASSDALITDASSTKRAICAAAGECFVNGARFVGGHPMAGNERSGLGSAHAALFRGSSYALVDLAETGEASSAANDRVARSDRRLTRLLDLIAAIGARPMWMDAATHDRTVAVVSHLPQLLAVALAGVVRAEIEESDLPLALAGRGLRDALRLAGSPYDVWRDIVLTNTDNLDAALARTSQAIEYLRANLRQSRLETEFARANEVYRILRELQ